MQNRATGTFREVGWDADLFGHFDSLTYYLFLHSIVFCPLEMCCVPAGDSSCCLTADVGNSDCVSLSHHIVGDAVVPAKGFYLLYFGL